MRDKTRLVGYRKRVWLGNKPREPYYAFLYDNMLIPVQMFREHYDTDGEIERVVLGDNKARRN